VIPRICALADGIVVRFTPGFEDSDGVQILTGGCDCDHGKWLARAGPGRVGELAGARPLLVDFGQLARSVVDRVFKFISAGLARPHVPDPMVGKMFRPFRLAQTRTTLRALMHCYSIHRLLPPPMSSWDAVPKPKDDGDMKTCPASSIVFWINRGNEMCNRTKEQPRRSSLVRQSFGSD
jgi:hypothetical protein